MNKTTFQAVVYDDNAGWPLTVTLLGNQLWVTTPNEQLQPLADYYDGTDTRFCYLCDAGGTVDTLALAKMLGKAVEMPEIDVEDVLARRIDKLKRLGVSMDGQSAPLQLEVAVFRHDMKSHRQGKYSVWCTANGYLYDMIFDIDNFDNADDASELAKIFLDFLKCIGIRTNVTYKNW